MKIKSILVFFIFFAAQSLYAVNCIFFQNTTDKPIRIVASFEFLVQDSKDSGLYVTNKIYRDEIVYPMKMLEFYKCSKNVSVTSQAKFFDTDNGEFLGEVYRKTIRAEKCPALIYKINYGATTERHNWTAKLRKTRNKEKKYGLQDKSAVHAFPMYTNKVGYSETIMSYIANKIAYGAMT